LGLEPAKCRSHRCVAESRHAPKVRAASSRDVQTPSTHDESSAQQDAPREAAVLRMRFEGAQANRQPVLEGLERLPGKSNYFIGNDPKRWHTDVPQYAKVRYQGLYPGIDLVAYGNPQRLEYDFVRQLLNMVEKYGPDQAVSD